MPSRLWSLIDLLADLFIHLEKFLNASTADAEGIARAQFQAKLALLKGTLHKEDDDAA